MTKRAETKITRGLLTNTLLMNESRTKSYQPRPTSKLVIEDSGMIDGRYFVANSPCADSAAMLTGRTTLKASHENLVSCMRSGRLLSRHLRSPRSSEEKQERRAVGGSY